MAWTEQQKNAIDIRNASVIVSAAAGSGKTAVLTERLAQLIADENAHIRADRIIVVTFTNDAASELRKRLDSKLRDLISNDPGNRYLLKQQTLLQSAKISTINAFCFELLRDNINEQGITSGFTVLDETENELIKTQSMDELLNYYSAEEYDKISFVYDKFCLKSDDKLAEVIDLADKYLSSAAMRDKWLDDAVNAFDCEPCESIYFKKLVESVELNLNKAMDFAVQRLDMFEDIFDDTEKNAAVKYMAQAEEDIVRIKNALDIISKGKIPEKEEIKSVIDFGRLVTVKRTEDVNAAMLEFCSAKRKSLIQLVKESMQLFDGFEADFEDSRQVTVILAEMLRKYHEIIWEKKCEKNALSFDDGERLVLELLADIDENGNIIQSETAVRIAEYYDIIMIDEYQDSNNKQDLIFKLISKDYHIGSDNIPIYGSNAFLVGDVKQSIYKFRLANPKNFITTLKSSEPYEANSKSNNFSVFLNKNFRSSMGVIDFVNFVFSDLMTEKCGDVDYNSDEQLYFGAGEYGCETSSFRTNIAFINTDSDDDEDTEELSKNSVHEINPEAVYTAAKISSMIQNGEQVILKDGRKRPCEPSDFCILIRKNRYTKEYISELEKLGIEAKGEEEKGYLNSREIAVLIDFLRIIDNPLLDVPLAAVMMSPMYMFEFEEIAYLKTFDKNRHIFVIMNELVNGKYGDSQDAFFIERCANFLKSLSRFRLFAVTMTVGELIDKVYDDTDFISVMQLYTDGEKKRANLRALIQYAKSYESSSSFEGSGGLSGFVRYIDRIIENGTDFSQGKVSSSTGNYVSVKTIHKSKGLEYPFVFLAETSSNIKKDYPTVMCSDDSRIGYILYDQKLLRRYRTGAYNQIIRENNADILSEEMRLLYVALTRAKQKIFINLRYNEKKIKAIEKLILTFFQENESLSALAPYAKCHGDWIWMSLFEHDKFADICRQIGVSQSECGLPAVKNRDNIFDVEFVQPKSYTPKQEINESYKDTPPEIIICDELSDIINFNYDRFLSEMPAKLSVTQITKKFNGDKENFDFKLKRPRFAEEKSELTGVERGTAIHTFFQYCDFDKARYCLEDEIDRMIQKGYLSNTQADSICRENAAAFFESDLFARIKRSESVYREKKFMVAIADLDIESEFIDAFRTSDGMIKGIVDLAFEENGNLVIVDYKSDRKTSESVLANRYRVQLKIYKAALELTMGMRVSEAYLYSFELKGKIKIDI